MKKFCVALSVITLCFALGACSKKKTGTGTGEDGTGISDSDIALQNERFGGGTIPKASEGGPFADIHFDFNSSQVPSESLGLLQGYAKTIQGDPTLRVEVEGHCDKRGTTEYNMALGERRAKAVAGALTRYGASSSQLSIVSYGEEIAVDNGDSEEAYARNRRAHLAVYKK